MTKDDIYYCPRCGETSGNDWTQCRGVCPIPGSPHYSTEPEASVRIVHDFDPVDTGDEVPY